jgi:replicative DNA helicase
VFEEEDWSHTKEKIGKQIKVNLHISDRCGTDVPYIWSNVRKMRREYGRQTRILVIIDYLQLM